MLAKRTLEPSITEPRMAQYC